MRVLLRRPKVSLETELSRAGINLNTANHRVGNNGKEVKLIVKEFAILEYFLRNKNKVLNRYQIINHVWDFEYATFSNIVDVHIKNLRKKLQGKSKDIFETIHGVGYRFND